MATRIQVDVNLDTRRLQKKFQAMQNDQQMMLEIHTLLARTVDPWVPYLHGPLSQTIEITPECVRYVQPYARYQYFGVNFNHTRDTHPLASAMWDKAAMQTQREKFNAEVADIVRRRAKETSWWQRLIRTFQ